MTLFVDFGPGLSWRSVLFSCFAFSSTLFTFFRDAAVKASMALAVKMFGIFLDSSIKNSIKLKNHSLRLLTNEPDSKSMGLATERELNILEK